MQRAPVPLLHLLLFLLPVTVVLQVSIKGAHSFTLGAPRRLSCDSICNVRRIEKYGPGSRPFVRLREAGVAPRHAEAALLGGPPGGPSGGPEGEVDLCLALETSCDDTAAAVVSR